MRSLAGRLLVLGLVWMMTPGLTEAAENLWHLMLAGHTAHSAEAGPDHAPAGEEHGCSGTFHLCSCHSTPPLSLTEASGAHEMAPPVEGPRIRQGSRLQSPDLPGIYRPPRA